MRSSCLQCFYYVEERLDVSVEGMSQITLSTLNASELAQLTGSTPVYDVIKPSLYTMIVLKSGKMLAW